MQLYDYEPAPSPRRVRIYLAEKGIELPVRQVDLAAKEQLSDQFRAINPFCTVPVLELDDGSHIAEVVAICDYLEGLYPEPRLFGSNLRERAEVTTWNTRIEQHGLAAIAESLRNHSRGFSDRALPGALDVAQIPELVPRGRRRAEFFMATLNERLAARTYVVGEFFSIADITALVFVDFASWIKLSPNPDATHLRRWYDDVSSRPSASA